MASSLSKAYEKKILEHILNKAALTKPEVWIALLTTVATSSSTGSTIVEASYTGYKRLKLTAANWEAAVEGSPTVIKNAEALAFAACTGGSSKIVGFALCDAETTGNVIGWGECTGEVSTTQTPAEFAIKALEATLS
jgi:hypothetical protein